MEFWRREPSSAGEPRAGALPSSWGSGECHCRGQPPQAHWLPPSLRSHSRLPSLHSSSACSPDRAPDPSVDHTEAFTQETPSWWEAEGGLGLHHLWHLLSPVLIAPDVSISQMETLML